MLKHLTHLCVFVDLDPPGIYGIQFHYDDRGPIPAVSPAMGKGVSFMINGTLDETMCAALTFYSERSQSAGLTVTSPTCLLVHDLLSFANRYRSSPIKVDEQTFRLQIPRMMDPCRSILLTSILMPPVL